MVAPGAVGGPVAYVMAVFCGTASTLWPRMWSRRAPQVAYPVGMSNEFKHQWSQFHNF